MIIKISENNCKNYNMTSLNTKNSKVTKNQRPKRQSEEEKYKLREKVIKDDADRKKKLHLHSTNLTTSQVKDTKPQPPYDR
ncbi:6480_t:CDS:2 [Rhizophagus irregularis]|nr:6480_t:CDS:2 [Rhizophagus irregularis]